MKASFSIFAAVSVFSCLCYSPVVEGADLLPQRKLNLFNGNSLSLGTPKLLADTLAQPESQQPFNVYVPQKKSYGIALPLAFIVGFGTGHFYVGAMWRGLRYLAYDLVAIAVDTAIILLVNSYSGSTMYAWIIAGIIFAGARIYQTVDCGKTVYDNNKGFDVRDSMNLPVSPSLIASNVNDGGMRGRLNTVYSF
ncbi:MAG: hypothetical protein WC552_09960 [Candidatus Omnitrophota bacterium]